MDEFILLVEKYEENGWAFKKQLQDYLDGNKEEIPKQNIPLIENFLKEAQKAGIEEIDI